MSDKPKHCGCCGYGLPFKGRPPTCCGLKDKPSPCDNLKPK